MFDDYYYTRMHFILLELKKKHKKTEKSRLERSVYSMSKCPKCVICKVYQFLIRRADGPSKGASTK